MYVCKQKHVQTLESYTLSTPPHLGVSPGIVVMGGDSCSKGRELESRQGILDGHFFTVICCKNCNVRLKRQK